MTVELSYSKLQSYERCPWLYHLAVDEHWRSGPHAGQAMGQSLHQTLAAFLEPDQKDRSLPKLLELWDENWVNEGYGGVEDILNAYQKGKGWLELFHQNQRARFDRVEGTEVDFGLDIPDIRFRGTVDRIDKNPDGSFTLVEYKTNAAGWDEKRIADDLQMTLYDMGVRDGLRRSPLHLEFYFFSNGRTVPTRREAGQTRAALQRLRNAAEGISAGRFDPDQSYCPKCEFNQRCDYSRVRAAASR